MSLQTIAESATNPQVAVPVSTVGAVANFMDSLPHIVTAGWAVYVTMLICHKGWQMYKEWRDDPSAPGKEQ